VTQDVQLNPIGSDRFTGVFNAPANTGIFPSTTRSSSRADDIGQQTIVSGDRVTVAAETDRPAQDLARSYDFLWAAQGSTALRTWS